MKQTSVKIVFVLAIILIVSALCSCSIENYATKKLAANNEILTYLNDNELFADILNFYLSFNDDKETTNNGYYEVLNLTSKPFSLRKSKTNSFVQYVVYSLVSFEKITL